MKTILAILALSAIGACQEDQKSSPLFQLMIESSNSTLNGTVLGACHQGAVTEGFCYTGKDVAEPPSWSTSFYFNVSSSAEDDIDKQGTIGWTLHGGNFNLTSSMSDLSYDPTSNLAHPIISAGANKYSGNIYFGSCGHLYIADYTDDTTDPATYLNPPAKLENWYICLTRWSYLYWSLVWKVGTKGEPQNPTCQKVRVKRVFNQLASS
ncbi:hypothetical protein K504DRAFT_475705 [Pleomassaria siparia CBS 279.74]|uniref:DUF7907 domain-containing protein n=1 Tax=Pleomassaria siparia CBS 279.74 TaxID=1314801 RepID=A0A6G1KCY8_9PLEO|nr:hypothetical protein K504DRAFT_475705 [Pleomassaria siparia CBS 279.74]